MKTILIALLSLTGITAHAQTMKWHYYLKDVSFGQTAAKDVDGDGKLELVFSTYWNDSNVYCLNAENGSLKWKHSQPGPGGGCNDAGPLIFDPFNNGNYKVVIPGSCMDTTFCVDADSGYVQWKTITGGGDSPPSMADADGDGYMDVLHGTFFGNVHCLDGRSGTKKWTLLVDTNAAIESEPAIMKNGMETDFAVATWDFNYDSNRIACYRLSDHSLKWRYYVHDLLYHGPAVGDLFRDGQKELVIGDYDGYLYCIRSGDGMLMWKDSVSKLAGGYIGAPVTMADLDNDGYLDIIYMDGSRVRAVNRNDSALWSYTPPSDYTSFRGSVVADINNDDIKDVTFCTHFGTVISLDGVTGSVIRTFDLLSYAVDSLGDTSSIFEVDNAPIISDFDNDGILDLFIIGGKGRSDSTTHTDYGYAFCLSWGVGNGPDWTMFRHDEWRTGCLCDSAGLPLAVSNTSFTRRKSLDIYPDPSPGAFNAAFTCARSGLVIVSITDMSGRVVMPPAEKYFAAGPSNVFFSNEQTALLSNGIYLVQVRGDGINAIEKLVIQR